MDIIYERNIGFIYDLCQVIVCKTSKRDSWINAYVLNGREEADVEQMDMTLKQFSSVDRCWNCICLDPNDTKYNGWKYYCKENHTYVKVQRDRGHCQQVPVG